MKRESKVEKEILLKEYEIGNELSQTYFKGSWTATSILLPICFALVAVSFTKETLVLTWEKLLPLAVASVFLYVYSWCFSRRYAGYNHSIWERLRDIETEVGMHLHHKIKKDDDARRKWRLWLVTFALGLLLGLAWGIRLYLAPLTN